MIISQHPGISLATVEKQTMVRENRLLYATTTLRCQLHRIPSESTKGLRGSSARKAPRAVASPQKRRLDEGDADDSVTDDATVTRGPKTVFGVGIGVFLIFLFFFVCWSICLDCYHGRLLFCFDEQLPCCYNKPFSTVFCCFFWYGIIIIYLIYAPRQDQTYVKGERKEFSENYYDKYWVTFCLGFFFFWFGLFWLQDLINHNQYASPNPSLKGDIEEKKIEAMPRSNL